MSIYTNFSVLNIHNTPAAITDVFANRPAASTDVISVGTIFISTDTQAIYSFDGNAWVLIGSGTGGGGGTNPTDLYIPYNDEGTFADSYLVNDTSNILLKTNYNGTDYGLKIDFVNEKYYLGDYDTTLHGYSFQIDANTEIIKTTDGIGTASGIELDFYNGLFKLGKSGSDRFEVGNNGLEYIKFGDVSSANGGFFFSTYDGFFRVGTELGTKFEIDRNANILQTLFNNVGIGLSVNFDDSIFSLGDFNQIYNGTALKIDDVSQYIKTFNGSNGEGLKLDFQNMVYAIGDYDYSVNGSYLEVDDTNISLNFYNNTVSNGLLVDFNKKWFKIGDWNNQYNNSHFYIDDPNSKITWFTKQKPYFDDLGTGNMLSNSSSGNSGQHLIININGTTYKIQLLNP